MVWSEVSQNVILLQDPLMKVVTTDYSYTKANELHLDYGSEVCQNVILSEPLKECAHSKAIEMVLDWICSKPSPQKIKI